MLHDDTIEALQGLRGELLRLRTAAVTAEQATAPALAHVHPVHARGAANLVHYTALRRHDLRDLQSRLTAQGLSSLGRMESDVLGNLDAVLAMIAATLDASPHRTPPPLTPADPSSLAHHTSALLGGAPEDRLTRIMVTMPTEAAEDPQLVARFAAAGMDVARINCAHDDPAAWAQMAAHVRASGRARIATDLAGPKVRTGPIAPGPRVRKIRPTRDALGRVTAHAEAWLVAAGAEAPPGAAAIPVRDARWLEALTVCDTVEFTDTRGRTRYMIVCEVHEGAARIEGDHTAYVAPGIVLDHAGYETVVTDIPPIEQPLRVAPGDILTLTASLEPGSSHEGRHRLGCTLPQALQTIRVGDRVLFDDGKIEGRVRAVEGESTARGAEIEITHASPRGTKLRAEKGINLPDTDLPVAALTEDDRAALDAVVAFADIVQLSFVRSPADVTDLFDALDARGAGEMGIIVKIETVRGFRSLPEILLTLMQRPLVGVMIARGDLGVEAGWERLAEVQEEILWLCEAAHVPVVWATQVLDSLADSGVPTRAEVTDAAAGDRAECVMLNKGPHIEQAITALDDILRRMHGHMDKKRPLLRRLRAWSHES
ncbi:pyruvate kinase [Microbacterium sediminicola]|uniref:pyruvate kinase n=1 Tax=Microbacterium sediminicola TaxID=415210 RepID=A0ABP4TW45_9MICO